MIRVQRVKANKSFKPTNKHALYSFRSKKRIAPLYDGQTDHMKRRAYQHSKKSTWHNEADHVYIIDGISDKHINRVERAKIRASKPIHNKQHNGDNRRHRENGNRTSNYIAEEHLELTVFLVILAAIVLGVTVVSYIIYLTAKIVRKAIGFTVQLIKERL